MVFFAMSAIGPKRTSLVTPPMSAFGGKADIALPVKMSANGKMNHAIDMLQLDRRRFAIMAVGGFATFFPTVRSTDALDAKKQLFIAEAARMKQEAIASGDQPFGAVMVVGDTIVGYGPSRVVIDRNPNAHAERVALWDAQRRLGNRNLSGAIIYSTSRPCLACEKALADSSIERMFFGPEATDAGKPERT
jgi:tRNA(Arg) A34 adenosine deaminase TadA